jgi:diguanylate cyclase
VTAKYLTEVLGQSQHIHALIKQSAADLSSVNSDIERAIATMPLQAATLCSGGEMESALDKNAAVLRQLQTVSVNLTAMNQSLQIGIRDRTMVDHQLAASEEQEEGARNAALHDQLTTLPNRALFNDRLEHGIAQAKRYKWILAVMFVDLNKFKDINDTYGHQAGDAVLRTVAMRLKRTTRNADTISRFGGDEFLCVLTSIHEQNEIGMIAAKILKAIQAPCDLRVGDAIIDPCLDASIGISVFPKDGASAAALINRADQAMYAAKESKSGFAFAQYSPAQLKRAVTYRWAIGRGIVSRHAPPIFDVESPTVDQPLQ